MTGPNVVRITVPNVEVSMLRTQRNELLTAIEDRDVYAEDHPLQGLVHLLDYMLDKAEGFTGLTP